jgi:hypothetical protein
MGHVMRHAIEVPLWQGIFIAMIYSVIAVIVVNAFIPPTVPAT